MPAAKKPTLPVNMYLLCLVAPGYKGVQAPYPIAIFTTAEEAVRFAAGEGIPADPTDPENDADAVRSALNDAGHAWPETMAGVGYRPFGYKIIKFVKDMDASLPAAYAEIAPYDVYSPAEDNPNRGIDPTRPLNWF